MPFLRRVQFSPVEIMQDCHLCPMAQNRMEQTALFETYPKQVIWKNENAISNRMFFAVIYNYKKLQATEILSTRKVSKMLALHSGYEHRRAYVCLCCLLTVWS